MTDMTNPEGRSWGWVRPVAWGGVVALILTPAVAMHFTSEVNWTIGDFLFACLLFGSVGLALELVVRTNPNWAYRGGAALALATSFLLIWANGAVGYIGSEENPYNLVFFGVIAIALFGAAIARFRSGGMARAMLAAAIAHAAAGAGGFSADPVTGPITLVFTAMWLAAAALFRKASRDGA